MMGAKKTQVFLIGGALVLFVLLFIAPKNAPSKEKKEAGARAATADIEVYVNMASKSLEPSLKTKLDGFVAGKQFDSIVAAWSKLKRPDIAAYYSEKQAHLKNSAQHWFETGNRYYYSVQFTRDESEIPALYQSAMRCYRKSIELDSTNTNAKVMLASCYVEGPDPMQGISMLREIERTDSNNVQLQMAFASFSVKSGQLDKAVSRFNKAIQADSNYTEAYLYLADVYEQQGETQKTIETLRKYAARIEDPAARNEVNNYINELRNRINN